MAIVGALTYVSLIAIGVPFAIPLSVIVAFGELIPLVGSWLARIPLLAIAALDSPRTFARTRETGRTTAVEATRAACHLESWGERSPAERFSRRDID